MGKKSWMRCSSPLRAWYTRLGTTSTGSASSLPCQRTLTVPSGRSWDSGKLSEPGPNMGQGSNTCRFSMISSPFPFFWD